MASIQKDIHVGAAPREAWEAVRDYGAVHKLAPGFVTDTDLDGDDRIVTFVSGSVARERLITVDEARRRLVYTVVEGPLGAVHHQASVEVVNAADGGDGCRLLWTTDVLPNELAPMLDALMEQGATAIRRALAV